MPSHWLWSFTIWSQSLPRHLLAAHPHYHLHSLLVTHTDLNACWLFHTFSCLFFTLANNISSMQSIHSSRSISDVPSSVEPSPTLSGPHSYFLLRAPTGPCLHFIREHHLFPGVIPPVNLEQGICHVHWRIDSILSWWVLRRYAIHSTIQWINE